MPLAAAATARRLLLGRLRLLVLRLGARGEGSTLLVLHMLALAWAESSEGLGGCTQAAAEVNAIMHCMGAWLWPLEAISWPSGVHVLT